MSRVRRKEFPKTHSWIPRKHIRIFRSDFQPIFMYLCRVSFLTTLDIYKTYFKGRHIEEYKENTSKGDRCLVLSKRSYCVFAPQGFETKCFLIFIVDKVKNFAANNLLQVCVLVMYQELRIIGQSRTVIRTKRVAFIY